MSARPAVLRELLERYERLSAQSPEVLAEPRIGDLLRDTAYTLCVTTGTRDIDAALAAARARLAGTAKATVPAPAPAPAPESGARGADTPKVADEARKTALEAA
ncbi:DUF5133 domain-containing protein [Actinacidiphila alni]|uniref:DUF5133 domain-containing protein n=1 Tax=Actinacidiphila alni TaxID=380248 RepID=UPI003451F9B1